MRGRRRPDRGGRPMLGDGGPRRAGCPTTKGSGGAVDADRFFAAGMPESSRASRLLGPGGSSRPRRISGQLGLDSGREQPPGHRQAHRQSHDAPGRPATSKHHGCRPGVACDFAGPGVLIGKGLGDPGLSVASVSDVCVPAPAVLGIPRPAKITCTCWRSGACDTGEAGGPMSTKSDRISGVCNEEV